TRPGGDRRRGGGARLCRDGAPLSRGAAGACVKHKRPNERGGGSTKVALSGVAGQILVLVALSVLMAASRFRDHERRIPETQERGVMVDYEGFCPLLQRVASGLSASRKLGKKVRRSA